MNQKGIRTHKGSVWGGNYVYAVIKSHKERLEKTEFGLYDKQIQIEQTFTIVFKMKIVGDKLSYLDERNKKLGYEITGGKTRKKSPVMNFTAGCGKNKKN